MKKNFLIFICTFFIIYNAYSDNTNILQELEFYSEKTTKFKLKEKNKSTFRENLDISEKEIDDLIDNRKKLTSDKNNLKILEQNIKINHSEDLTFVQERSTIQEISKENQNNSFDDINVKTIEIDSISSPILKFITKTIRPFLENRIDNILIRMGITRQIKDSLNLSSKLKIHTLYDGFKESNSITCGNNVEISLKVDDEYGNNLQTDYDNQRFLISVGQNNLTRGLELGLIGAKIGEEREIVAPLELNLGTSLFSQKLIKATKKATFKAKVHDIIEDEELKKIQENLHYYDVISSLSRQLSCGDFVKINLKLLNSKGEILYEKPKDQILYLILGSNMSKYLEQVLLGMRFGGTRIALSNTENLQTLKKIPALNGIEKILNEYSGVVIELSATLAMQ
jgi:FKBP-type peptidyl-prolyl cis-trans isomerase 2